LVRDVLTASLNAPPVSVRQTQAPHGLEDWARMLLGYRELAMQARLPADLTYNGIQSLL
jgi:hypothetical protein